MAWFSLASEPFWTVLLFVGACAGHTALMVRWLNLLYGFHLPRSLLRAARKVNVVLILLGPPLVWLALGLWREQRIELDWHTLPGSVLAAYVALCWALGFAVVPITTLRWRLRPRARALLSNHTATVDVAAELGYKPIGLGRHRWLARLPRNEVFRVDFAERILRLPQLPPAWDGLTILHLSDLHFRGSPDRIFYQRVMDRCRDWDPDLVALTGDIVDSDQHHRWIVPVLGRLGWRLGAFAILGNHDLWHNAPLVRRRLQRLGMRVLGNGWERIDIRGEPLVMIGHEGPWFRPAPNLAPCPPGFRLCLSHTPDNVYWARQQQIDLMLAGHVHGGQIRLPLLGSVFVPSYYGRRFDCGTFDLAPTLLHVSRGLGGQHPVRYNCRPEVTKLVLRK